MSLSIDELEVFTRRLAASPERWRHLVRHADDARVYEQVWDDDEVNAWVICWSEDQDTGFHDHDDSPPLRRTGAYRVGRDGTVERESQAFETELRGEPALA